MYKQQKHRSLIFSTNNHHSMVQRIRGSTTMRYINSHYITLQVARKKLKKATAELLTA